MVVVEPKHRELWLKAAAHTVPGVDEAPPSYGAKLRKPTRRQVDRAGTVEAESEPPELEAIGAE